MPEAKKVVMIDCATLTVLLDVAKHAEEDLQSGLRDGTYEADAIAGHTGTQVARAILVADGLMA